MACFCTLNVIIRGRLYVQFFMDSIMMSQWHRPISYIFPPCFSFFFNSPINWGTWAPCAPPPPPPPPRYTSALLTQSVASNIFRSNGSPTSSPSMRVREWQVAMAAMNGPLGRVEADWTTGRKVFPWSGTTPHRSRESSVKVPVWDDDEENKDLKISLLSCADVQIVARTTFGWQIMSFWY